jgi:carboxypeptidase C (cathepsin A)
MYSTPLLTALLALLPATLAVHPHERLRAPKLRIPVASAIPTSTASVRTPSPTSTSATRISNPTSPFFVPTFRNANASALRVPYPLPLVGFPLQASWAGRLPINDTDTERRELFFWYWPASQRSASDTLTIWLNGGQCCLR